MAHTCPDCGYICYCCGDIDDIDFGEADFCRRDHGGCTEEDYDEDDWVDDDYDFEDDDPTTDN